MNTEKKIRVSMDEETLQRLLFSGALCVADFKCLDCDSKACVWKLALKSAGDSMSESVTRSQIQLSRVHMFVEFGSGFVRKMKFGQSTPHDYLNNRVCDHRN